jgi:hypothetical protein
MSALGRLSPVGARQKLDIDGHYDTDTIRAAGALTGLGIEDVEDLRRLHWSDEAGLRAALLNRQNCGPQKPSR